MDAQISDLLLNILKYKTEGFIDIKSVREYLSNLTEEPDIFETLGIVNYIWDEFEGLLSNVSNFY